jgi:hypothetical protein
MSAVNYSNIAKVPEADRLQALAKAVNFDLSLPQLSLDIAGGKAAFGAVVVDATGKPLGKSFGVDSIKAALATKYATPGDNPALEATAQRVAGFFHSGINEIDLGWTNLFQFVDLRSSINTSFKILGASTSMQFKQRAPGEKVEINRNISSTDAVVEYVTYAAGLGILDDWLRFQQYWTIEQTVAEFRGKYYDIQAELHYGLFTALGAGINTAFATDATQTFNNAAASILRAMRASGYALGSGVQFTILTSPEKLGYVLKMLEATRGSQMLAFNANSQPIAYSVANVIASPHVAADDTGYYLIVPGRRLQRATWMDLQIESNRDIYKRAVDWVGTGQFNAAVGDTNQVRRVLFS